MTRSYHGNMSSQIEDIDEDIDPTPDSEGLKMQAARVACSFAEDPEDARMLLDMLGLSPSVIGEDL